MAVIRHKINTIIQALATLQESIELLREYEEIVINSPTHKNKQICRAMRDSMIQRFEYCTDLLWKVLQFHLQEVEKVSLQAYSPREILREAVKAGTITEQEGQECMEMVTARNRTSHIYHEEVAEAITQRVPEFYGLMKSMVDAIIKRAP